MSPEDNEQEAPWAGDEASQAPESPQGTPSAESRSAEPEPHADSSSAQWAEEAAPAAGPPPTAERPEAPSPEAVHADQASRLREMVARENLGSALQHEINNPLAGIIGNAELMLQEVTEDNEARRRLEDIIAQGERIRDAVRGLSRPQ
jgi:signal transduction histidine kinase